MFRRIVCSAFLLVLPSLAWAQTPRFEILAFIDNQWTVIDNTGAFVRTVPVQPAQRPGAMSLNHDETKLLLLANNWQTWLYDFDTATAQPLFQANWNAASHWLAGSSTEIIYNEESGSLFKFDILLGTSTLWQSNDTIGHRVLSRVQFGNGGQSAVMNVHYPGAGGMGVYLGDVCYADASHALCNLRPLAWPGNGSSSWSDVAANGVLTTDGLKAVYVERHGTAGAAYVHDISSNTRLALMNWTGNPEASGAILGLFRDRYALLVAQSIALPGGSAYYVCDIEAPGCSEILTRPGYDSLTYAVVARSFGGDTTPPSIDGPDDILVEATGPDGAVVTFEVTAVDDIDGEVTVTCDPRSGSTFKIMTTGVVCDAADAAGNASSLEFDVTVVDTTPPAIVSIVPDRTSLWPPNHKMVPINLAVEATDLVDAAVDCRITDISATSPLSSDDWRITGDLSAELRAKRPGSSAMTYTLTVGCSDGTNHTERTATIVVPHDQGQ